MFQARYDFITSLLRTTPRVLQMSRCWPPLLLLTVIRFLLAETSIGSFTVLRYIETDYLLFLLNA